MGPALCGSAGGLRSFVSWKIHNIFLINFILQGGESGGVRLEGGRRGAAAAGVAPAGRVPDLTCSTFPPVLAVSPARILPTLLLTVGGSPLPCRTWSCITLIRTEVETAATRSGDRAWAPLETDGTSYSVPADRQGEAEGRRGGGGGSAGGGRWGGWGRGWAGRRCGGWGGRVEGAPGGCCATAAPSPWGSIPGLHARGCTDGR